MKKNSILLLLFLMMFCCQSFCFSWTQMLGYVWICKKFDRTDNDQSVVLTGGFLDREHGCRTCKLCRKRYSHNPFWKIIWHDAPEQDTLECHCSVNGYIHDYRSAVKESSLLLDSCPHEGGFNNEIRRIENCNGILTCGDCSKQIKNP